MAMAGAIGGARWRSPPPLALRYVVDVDSTPLARADGVALAPTLALKFRNFFIPSCSTAAPALDFPF